MVAILPANTAGEPTADPPMSTLTLVILDVLPVPVSVMVNWVKVTAALPGLFILSCMAVTLLAPESSLTVPVTPALKEITSEVGVEVTVGGTTVEVGVEVLAGTLVLLGVNVTVGAATVEV